MAGEFREYSSDDITVQYSVKRCIHAAECVRRLNNVFDPNKRPWIQPANASADELAEVVPHCPSGALRYARQDGGAPELIPPRSTVKLVENGPLYVRGDITLSDSQGTILAQETREALCRCGASNNKPFCDNSHKDAAFEAEGHMAAEKVGLDDLLPQSALHITATQNGPLKVEGAFEILDADGDVIFRGSKAWLCRCGGSANKPFCDGTHNHNGFQAD